MAVSIAGLLLDDGQLGSNARKSARRILRGEGDNIVFLATRSFQFGVQETQSILQSIEASSCACLQGLGRSPAVA